MLAPAAAGSAFELSGVDHPCFCLCFFIFGKVFAFAVAVAVVLAFRQAALFSLVVLRSAPASCERCSAPSFTASSPPPGHSNQLTAEPDDSLDSGLWI